MSNKPTQEQRECLNEVTAYFGELLRLYDGEILEELVVYKHLCKELVECRDELLRKNKERLTFDNQEDNNDERI